MSNDVSFLVSRLLAVGSILFAAACGDLGAGLPPWVDIIRPSDGEVFILGRHIPLDCDVEAADGSAVTVDWSAFPGGAGPRVSLADSVYVSTNDLGVGNHQIQCVGSDGELENTDLVTITVTNQAPVVRIVNPDPDGALTFFAGETIAYVGSVLDANHNAELGDLQWDLLSTTPGGGTLLTDEGQRGTIPPSTLEPGEYQLRAWVRDALGEVDSTWITFDVLPDPEDLPPSILDGVVAAYPLDQNDLPPVSYFIEQCLVDINGDGYHDGHDRCQRLTFSALVDDDHDAPEELTYTWTLRKDDAVVDTFTTPASVIQLDLAPGRYELELVATDTASNDSAPYFFPFIVTDLN